MDDQLNQVPVAAPRRDWVKLTLAVALVAALALLIAQYLSCRACRLSGAGPMVTVPTESGDIVIPGRPMTDEERARAMAEWQAAQQSSR